MAGRAWARVANQQRWTSQEAVGKFLRNQLNPVLTKHQCGGVVIHHTNKPVVNPNQLLFDPAYLGAGSAEWANWAREVLALRKTFGQ
jgi:hypothetical protein